MLNRIAHIVIRPILGFGLQDAKLARRIAFIHIPRCGGSSVAETLRRTYFPVQRELYRRWFEGSAYSSVRINPVASATTARALGFNLQELRAALLLYELSLESTAYVTGHVPFTAECIRSHAARWRFVTTLREPVDRFFSEYFYNRFKEESHYKVDDEILPYLETPDARRTSTQLVNLMTGRTDVYSEPGAADIDLAIEHLRHFTVVGFVDEMGRFAADMGRLFGKCPVFPRVNQSRAPESVRSLQYDSAIRRKVERLCAADIEVYQRAFAIWRKKA